jgi:hypothetical protein
LASLAAQASENLATGVTLFERGQFAAARQFFEAFAGERISKSEQGVSRRMQQQSEKELHYLETNLLGRTLPLRQTLADPTEESNWTKPERFPDFFLIGAPRCGTTSLSRWLESA